MNHWIGMYSGDHVSPFVSTIGVYGFGTAIPLIILLVCLLFAARHWLRGRSERAMSQPGAKLPSGECVLHGSVEYDEGADLAVRVEIDQVGTESESSGSWSHVWSETDRRMLVRPFYLRQEGGTRIRVEPTENTLLIDDVDGVVRHSVDSRTRIAELSPGEEVYIHGSIQMGYDPHMGPSEGYRGGGRHTVLRAPQGRPMMISSHSLGDRFFNRARYLLTFASLLFVVAFGFHLLVLPYHTMRSTGATSKATVTKLETWQTRDSEGDMVSHYRVTLQLLGRGFWAFEDVSGEDYAKLKQGDTIAVITSGKVVEMGEVATAPAYAFLVVFVMPMMTVVFAGLYFGSRPWSEQKLKENGSGRLQESA